MPRKKKDDASVGPRKPHGLTQVQLAKTAKTTQRSVSSFGNGNGISPAPIVVVLAHALRASAGELLGLKPPPTAAPALRDDHPEPRRLWKRFRVVTQLTEKDPRAVIRLIDSSAALVVPRKNEMQGARHGR